MINTTNCIAIIGILCSTFWRVRRFIVPCSGSTSSRVKKRGKGRRLLSQAKYVIMSVRKFFEKERENQKSILCDQIVKRTSAACGVGTATVVRICKEYEGNSGLLSSPEKQYTASRVQIVLPWMTLMLKQFVKKYMHSMAGKEYPDWDPA